jgi:DNA gyrase/topoisomerase IV subunit B
MVESFLELIEINDILLEDEYLNMVDISVNVEQSFLLSNGLISHNSAISSYRKYRNNETQGAFALRGKFINASEATTQKLMGNNEVINLMAAIGLKLGQKELSNLRYGKIIFYCDSDHDGSSIVALLINFMYKYWPELFDKEMIFKAETPIVVVKNIKNKKKTSFYKQDDYNKWLVQIKPKEWEIEYKKGLAALLDDEYAEIINNPILTKIKSDETSKTQLNVWFGKESELRKNEMLK